MENNEKGEIDLENNEELEEADIYADLENNIENAKNLINQPKINKYEEQENMQEEQEEPENENENENENSLEDPNNNNEDDEDDRLTYTLITLDLGELIHIFEENNISFVDMLLLSKDDLKELQLKLYQRNRIHNFSVLFSKYAKNYSISEISDFFGFNQKFIFNSSIYDRVIMSQNQNDVWNNNENNENLNENNKDEINDEYNEENDNENIEEGNANININPNQEKYDLDNINYSEYMNYMNKENNNINNNTNNNNKAYNMQRVKPINNNTNYNDIKYNTFNNNNYNNNYYLSTDWKENNKINHASNIMTTDLKEARSIPNKTVKPLISKGINSSKINQIKNNDKKEKPVLESSNNITSNQPKEKKSKIIVNKKPIKSQTNVTLTSNINNNLLEPINSNINNNNTNLTNTNKIASNKKKSSNKINAVINKYLEIKQDADEFLEKLNKKKIDSQNKYNKYNILIKKKNIINTKVIEPNNNLNVVNSYKNIGANNSTQKNIGHKPMTKSSKIDEYNKIIQNYGKQNTNQENDLNQDIYLEYQKMNNQIGELEKINLDFNSKNHLNQIKKYIDEKGDNINLDDISKINSELIKMIEIIEKKEKLKQTLENYNLKIEQNKQLLNELNELDDNEQNESNENLENKINNANYENQINYNNFKNMNNYNANNQLLDEVEEEFENEMPKRK